MPLPMAGFQSSPPPFTETAADSGGRLLVFLAALIPVAVGLGILRRRGLDRGAPGPDREDLALLRTARDSLALLVKKRLRRRGLSLVDSVGKRGSVGR